MADKFMNDTMFDELLESTKQAVAISKNTLSASRRYTIDPPDIAAIRNTADKSQEDFARMIGVSVGTLRNWEQGRRKPEGPALALLKIVSADPAYVEKILATN
jgi:putative transcriptional regulator